MQPEAQSGCKGSLAADQTVRNRLNEVGMKAQCPLVGPVLTVQQRIARLAFPRELEKYFGRSITGAPFSSQMRALDK